MKIYIVKLTDEKGNEKVMEIMSTDIEWSMSQFQKNREPFTWKIVEETKYEG